MTDEVPVWQRFADPSVVAALGAVAASGGESMLYSSDWRSAVEAVKHRDRSAVEAAIVFLEVDPYFRFSGYEKERLYRYLSRAPLTDAQAERLRAFVLRRCEEKRYRHELRGLGRLGRALADPEFIAALRRLPRSADPNDNAAEEKFLSAIEAATTSHRRRDL